MLRYYSHYIFIYPDIYLKNCVVETNGAGYITRIFSFEKEIEKTEFYSGLLIFLPDTGLNQEKSLLEKIDKADFKESNVDTTLSLLTIKYKLHHKEDFAI